MNKKIYIIRGGGTKRESVNIRIDNLFQSFDPNYIVNIEFNFWSKNIFLKLIIILIFSIKVLFLVPRKSKVFFTIALIKSSIPAILLKKLKNCILIGDYDDTTLGNSWTINDYQSIFKKRFSISFFFFEYLAIMNSNYIIVISQNLKKFTVFIRGNEFINNIIFIPNGVDKNIFNFNQVQNSRLDLRRLFFINKSMLIGGYIGSLELNNDFYNFLSQFDLCNKNIFLVFILNINSNKVKELNNYLFKNKIENIKVLENIDHKEIPIYINQFDFGIDSNIIYNIGINGFQLNSRSGVKIKEFLALNIPIFSLNTGDAILSIKTAYPDLIGKLLIESQEQFISLVKNGLIDKNYFINIKNNFSLYFREKFDSNNQSIKLLEFIGF